MPVDIQTMRSEVSIQSTVGAPSQNTSDPTTAIDEDQLRETIRELVMEIVGDDIYALFRTRGI